MSSAVFYKYVFENLIVSVNSIGFNEQELAALYSFLQTSDNLSLPPFDPSLAYPNNPLPAQALDQMRTVFEKVGSKISRLHLHTLSFQAIMTKSTSAGKIPLMGGDVYLDSRRSVSRAALVAFEWICDASISDENLLVFLNGKFSDSTNDGSQFFNVTADAPVACWDDTWGFHICLSTMVVCKKSKATVGKIFHTYFVNLQYLIMIRRRGQHFCRGIDSSSQHVDLLKLYYTYNCLYFNLKMKYSTTFFYR